MRLIDADLLMQNLGFEDTEEERKENVGEIITWEDVDRMPTAFDVDEVVERLEKLKKAEQDRSDNCDESGCCDGEEIFCDGRSQGRFEAFGKAIEIVGGGVNEKL